MSLISIKNLTFAYEGSYDNIFENISFQIDTDWKLGFTGRNGKGKTTFLNLLLGKYEYSGSISSAAVDFEYFPNTADASVNRGIAVPELIERICPGYQEWELMRELTLLEVRSDVLTRAFDTLSEGEKTKVLLAALFMRENSFLLIDEPTNHLDMHGRELVSRYLNSKKGFILVSHDRAFLDGCIDHILSINRSNIEIQRGNFSSWYHNKQLQDTYELEKNENIKREVKRLSSTAREKAAWSDRVEASKIGTHQYDRGRIGHLAAKTMKRSKAIERRVGHELEEKSKLLKNIEKEDSLKVTQLAYHSSRFITLENVSIFYDDKAACTNISFTVERGDRIALRGRNGSGKSSIIKLILGEESAYSGKLQIGSGLLLSYVSQDSSCLFGNLSEYALENGIDESLFKTILRKLDFSRVQFEKDMSNFSGGQKKKVLIAKSLCEKAHLLIWDEPLNYIDVISRMQIEKLLLEFQPTILFVEHDSIFCDKIATKTVALS